MQDSHYGTQWAVAFVFVCLVSFCFWLRVLDWADHNQLLKPHVKLCYRIVSYRIACMQNPCWRLLNVILRNSHKSKTRQTNDRWMDLLWKWHGRSHMFLLVWTMPFSSFKCCGCTLKSEILSCGRLNGFMWLLMRPAVDTHVAVVYRCAAAVNSP